jgi:hypothetical protein
MLNSITKYGLLYYVYWILFILCALFAASATTFGGFIFWMIFVVLYWSGWVGEILKVDKK